LADRSQRRGAVSQDRNHLVAAVVGAFDVLEVFAKTADAIGYAEVVRQTGKPKASVHRILATLVNLGVITQVQRGEYKLTLKLWGLGMVAFDGIDLAKVAEPAVQEMMAAADETAHLAVLDGPDRATYLCKVETPRSVRVQFWVGKRVPSWRSATGRSMLAFRPGDVAALVAQSSPDIAGELEKLPAILSRVKACGYALTKGDNHPDLGGIAAPVRDFTQNVVASCGLAIPAYRMSKALIQQCVPIVLRTAQRISADLGHTQPQNVTELPTDAVAARPAERRSVA
jgi:DNA-binding IclR family transcriptional regulator